MNSRHSASRNKVAGTQYGAQPVPQDLPTPPMSRQGTTQFGVPAASSPRLLTQYPNSSPESDLMEYESDHDTRAMKPYDRRMTMQLLEEEEQNQKQRAQADSVYPSKTKRKHKPHTYISQPPAQAQSVGGGVALINAMAAAGMSGDQIATAIGKEGHTYGTTYLRGNGSILEGNTFNDDTMMPFLARHKYGSLSTSKEWTGNVYKGNHHSSAAQGFLLKGLPVPPTNVSGAINEEDSEFESEDDFS